jgi:hypothetical protein
MRNFDTEKYNCLRNVRNSAISTLEDFSAQYCNSECRKLARDCYPGRNQAGANMFKALFSPWFHTRWPVPKSHTIGEQPPGNTLADIYLIRNAQNPDAQLRRFIEQARHSPFRHLTVKHVGETACELVDTLDGNSRFIARSFFQDAAVFPDAMLFGQAVTLDGITVFTHPPVWISLDSSGGEIGRNFLFTVQNLARANKQGIWRNNENASQTLIESELFLHAKHQVGQTGGIQQPVKMTNKSCMLTFQLPENANLDVMSILPERACKLDFSRSHTELKIQTRKLSCAIQIIHALRNENAGLLQATIT